MKQMIDAAFVVALCVYLFGCGTTGASYSSGSSTNTSSTALATLSSIQANVFTASCTGCHSGSSPAGSMSLESGSSYASLVGATSSEVASLKRVNAGFANESYLINKLEGTQASAGGSGTQMPPGSGLALSSTTMQTIKDWINNGALNN